MSIIDFNLKATLGEFNLKAKSSFSKGINFIWGRSGNGKTTLLNSIAGFIPSLIGDVVINNNIIFSSKRSINIASEKRKISYVQQNERLFDHLTVIENVEFGYKFLNNSEKKITPSESLNLFEINQFKDYYPSQLSGGQKQRVALARSIARNGELLMLDEPLNSLDFLSRKNIFKSIEDISSKLNLCVLYISHSIDEIFQAKNDVLLVNKGNATDKKTVISILNYWNSEDLLNQIEKGIFSGSYFSAGSVMISKKKFEHNNLGLYFTGTLKKLVRKQNKSLLVVEAKKDYFVSIDNEVFNSLELKVKEEVNCFVYKNLIL